MQLLDNLKKMLDLIYEFVARWRKSHETRVINMHTILEIRSYLQEAG